MFWTVLALLLMVTLGGFISYYGDLQGRRWGKKRVTWFGLRPKYTAILITSITGGLIALMSIVTVLLVFPTVRDILLRGEQAIRDNKQLNAQLTEERQLQAAQLKTIDAKIEKREKEYLARIDTINAELNTRQQQLEEARKALVPTQQKLQRLETQQAVLEAKLKKESAELKLRLIENRQAELKRKELSRQYAKLSGQYADKLLQNQRLTNTLQDLRTTQEKMNRVIGNQTELQDTLLSGNEKLQQDNRRVHEENLQLEKTNNDRKSELAQNQQELDRVKRDLNRVNRDVDQANRQLLQVRQTFTLTYHALRQGEITVRAGAELARSEVPAHMSLDAARKRVRAILEEASLTAQGTYRAERGTNNRAVRIVSKLAATLIDSQDVGEPESIEMLASRLEGSDTPVLLVVTSINNCVEGEQVLVEIQLYKSIPIFKKGEAVATRSIDSRLSLPKVKEAITEFLKNDVKRAAVQAGIVPHVDPVTGLNEIGVYDGVALNVLADHIKRLGGSVLLKAVATTTITTKDALGSNDLRFESIRSDAMTPYTPSPLLPREIGPN